MNQIPNIEETLETYFPDDLRMRAYYYGFKATGIRDIDKILSAVAIAGKAFHSTDQWIDEMYEEGVTAEKLIQYAADTAALHTHQQLQKARHDWLREEIVRLEGMLSRWVAAYMPADEGKDPSKWGFKTEKEAWDFIEKRLTPCPLDPRDKSGEPCDSCMAEWMVYQIPEVDQALQTIIDRYHSELDQPNK